MKKTFTLTSIFCLLFELSIAQTTVTFNFTGTVQTFTVPPCADTITFDVQGAQGGSISNLSQPQLFAPGGLGGRAQGFLIVTPGQVLEINVGGKGTSDSSTLGCKAIPGGFNGGGIGQTGFNAYNYNAGGGGGASDIRLTPYTLADRLVVAGAGGGAGCSGCTGGALPGGSGGGLIGEDGSISGCFPLCQNGKGGTQSAGGVPGIWACAPNCTQADTGSFGIGGNGNDTAMCSGGVNCGSGGAGGGGWWGGGGGSNGPGGGGSSYSSGAAFNVLHTQGFRANNGIVTITYPSCVGINENQNQTSDIPVSPNPFNKTLNIYASGELKLFDAFGKLVLEKSITVENSNLDTGNLPDGVYYFQLKTKNGIANRKVVKCSVN